MPHDSFYINSVAVSGDGSKVVGGTFFHQYGAAVDAGGETGSFGTYCWSSDGTLLWQDVFAGWQGVYWVAISADGTTAASGGWMSGTPDYKGFIRAYDAGDPSGTPILDEATDGRTNEVALADDGGVLAAVAAGSIYLFVRGAKGGFSAPSILTPPGDGLTMETLALSADGAFLVVGDSNGKVYLAANDGGTARLESTFEVTNGGAVHSVAISADGSWAVAGGGSGRVYAFERSAADGTWTTAWTADLTTSGAVYGVAISRDAKNVTGVGNDGEGGAVSLFLNQGSAGTLVWTQTTPRNPNCTSMDGAGRFVAVADGHPDGTPGHFLLLSRADGGILGVWETSDMSWPMFLSVDGSTIAAGSDNSVVYMFGT
jgi:WD40 repeat protein